MLSSPKQFHVFTLPIHLLDDYTAWLWEHLQQKSGGHVVTLNAEMVMLCEQDSSLRDILKKAELIVPDGAGIIFYLRLRGYQQKRCPGIELAASLITKIGQEPGFDPICFYGGAPGVTEEAARFWQEKFPNLSILTQHGYLSPEEQQQWLQVLQQKQPRLILVGLGVPRQELWIQEHRHLCPESIWIGVGGSFDIWGGVKSRAPGWLRENNLEWLYRLYQEPWRWRRMLALPQFAWRSLISLNDR